MELASLSSGDSNFFESYLTRPEHELVLLCSRTVINEAQSSRLAELLKQQLDWDYLFHFARRHSMLPLVYLQLHNSSPASVPAPQLARLKRHYQENAARNLVLIDELRRILSSLSAAGIEAVPYKGPALALLAYGDLSLRRFIDLDIMVRKNDVTTAKEILISHGYVSSRLWTKSQQDVLLRNQHNLQFSRDEGRLILELHWEAASDLFASAMQAEKLWSRLEDVTIKGFTFKSFASEDLVLLLCVHGSRHLWERLAWICDVAELLRSRRHLNWDSLMRHADSSGNSRKLFLGLKLAAKLFQAPLSETVSRRIDADASLPTLMRQVEERLFNGATQQPASIRQIFRFNFQLREDWRARLRYCRHMLRPTDGDVSGVSLPSLLSFGYYLMRPWRLFRADRERIPSVSAKRPAQADL